MTSVPAWAVGEGGHGGDAFQGHLHPEQEKGGIGGKKEKQKEKKRGGGEE